MAANSHPKAFVQVAWKWENVTVDISRPRGQQCDLLACSRGLATPSKRSD